MPQWYDTTKLNHCLVYIFNVGGNSKYILFGPDLSKFKQFDNLQSLVDYGTINNLTLEFK